MEPIFWEVLCLIRKAYDRSRTAWTKGFIRLFQKFLEIFLILILFMMAIIIAIIMGANFFFAPKFQLFF